MRVHELAKELQTESKKLVAYLKESGIEVKSHMGSLTEEQAEDVRRNYPHDEDEPAPKKASPPKKKAKKASREEAPAEEPEAPAERIVPQLVFLSTGGWWRKDQLRARRERNLCGPRGHRLRPPGPDRGRSLGGRPCRRARGLVGRTSCRLGLRYPGGATTA